MIAVLRIQNMAVIEELEVEFGPGLNVITGETGAGKSIIVTALELLRGGRAAPHLVRTGEDTASVEALIEIDGEQLVVRRTISSKGRSRAYIDGEMCTVQALRERAPAWLDISGQHEHHALVDPHSHLGWLDRFARVDGLTASLAEAVSAAREALHAQRAFEESMRDRDERMDLLRFQLAEIERIKPKAGELEAVLTELETLSHATELRQDADAAAHRLLLGERSAVRELEHAQESIRRAARIAPTLEPLDARIESARIELEDIADELSRYASRLHADPRRLQQLREREQLLSRLVRRHGSLESALAHGTATRDELERLEDAEGERDRLASTARRLAAAAAKLAAELSRERKAHADRLAAAVSEELHDLGMGHARIEVSLDTVAARPEELQVDGKRLGPNGVDRAEFLIAPNPGELPRPLTKVASGGELSRSLLALKQVLAGLGPVGSYVFDEVDTGVGGAVAEAIGRKLYGVARHHQVLCITHQAVIAAWADQHFKVQKQVADGRTRTRVTELAASEREHELARMLGGAEITDGVRQAAADLLAQARQPLAAGA
ncbi:MAG: DNA repair protein RecN [Deltaproteobacteria bacterium]|nr:MAG: DNA repair protein RecN [Deltaproteobacteria bacterium]